MRLSAAWPRKLVCFCCSPSVDCGKGRVDFGEELLPYQAILFLDNNSQIFITYSLSFVLGIALLPEFIVSTIYAKVYHT